jgi:hypothetical protein
MRGLDPRIFFCVLEEMAGSSPAMTIEGTAARVMI